MICSNGVRLKESDGAVHLRESDHTVHLRESDRAMHFPTRNDTGRFGADLLCRVYSNVLDMPNGIANATTTRAGFCTTAFVFE